MFLWYAIAGAALILLVSFFRRADHYQGVCVATFLVILPVLLVPLGFFEGRLHPFTWDARLRAADLALGLDGFALSRWCYRIAWLRWLIFVTYSSLPFMFAVAWSLERSRVLVRAAVSGALLAFLLYNLIPAAGPQYAFAGWQAVVCNGVHSTVSGSADLIAVATVYPRNCVPSMHFTWALLLALNARNRLWRAVLLLYAGLMVIATVGEGEHYFVDLIAAVPFTLAVQAIAERWPPRSMRAATASAAASGSPGWSLGRRRVAP